VLHFIARVVDAGWRFIFKPAARYPADPRAVFILALSAFSGMIALLIHSAPATLEALLPRWGVVLWGLLLVVGSVMTLVGMVFQSVNGIIAEQLGSVIVGVTTVFYSVLYLVVLHAAALQTVGIILAYGLSCFLRWVQLQALINESDRRGQRQHISDIVEAAIQAEYEAK
jgi:hypothetical protein